MHSIALLLAIFAFQRASRASQTLLQRNYAFLDDVAQEGNNK